MFSKHKLFFVSTIASALVLSGMLAGPATADEPAAVAAPSSEAIAELQANLDELGVDASVREALIEKFSAGDLFDSQTGAAPLTTESYREGVTNYSRSIYADGSVSLTSVEQPELTDTSGAVARGVSGCAYSLNTGVTSWSNCKVEKKNGLLTMWYKAGYWRSSNGRFGTAIANTWDWDVNSVGANCQQNYLANPTSTKSRMRAACDVAAGYGGGAPYLDLDITASNVAVNANW